MLGQQIVELAVPEEHDFGIERDWFGLERLGGDEPQGFGGLFDFDLSGFYSTLQGLVCER